MTAQIIDVNGSKRNLVVEVPDEQVEEEITRIAQKYAKTVKVPGFRPGKVPLEIVRQRFSSELRGDATQDIIRRHWQDAVSEHKLQPLTEPVVENLRGDPGSPLQFTLSFEVLPQVEVKDYMGIGATLEIPEVSETDVDAAIEHLREGHAQFVPLDETAPARDGDYVTVTVDGLFEDGGRPVREEDATLVAGSEEANALFAGNLAEVRAGETRTFDMTYPADFERARLGGKTVHYTVAVKDVKEKRLPAINDDFAKDMGSEDLAQLRVRVRDELITKLRAAAEKKARESVLEEVVRRTPVDIPESLVMNELQHHARSIESSLVRQGIDPTKVKLDWKKILEERRPEAERTVHRSIVLDAIARQEGLEVTDEELAHELEHLAQGTQRSAAALRAQMEKDQRIQEFREHLRNNKALDFVYRNANISGG